MEYKALLATLAIVISLIGYVPYFRDLLAGRTKPHAFSWGVWTVITGLAFAIQFSENAGAGAWVTGFTGLICFTIFLLALSKGKMSFPLIDWVCLIAALIALALWWFAKLPLASVALLVAADFIAFVPTFRKAYFKPYEDTPITFGLNGFKFVISLFALESLTLTTALYPASLVLTNWSFAAMVYLRRRQLRK